MPEGPVKKFPCDLEDEINAMQGDVDVEKLREYQAVETVELMLVGIVRMIRRARAKTAGEYMVAFNFGHALEELHRVENFIKQEFPPKEPSVDD